MGQAQGVTEVTAQGMTEGTTERLAQGYIITTLHLFFNFIINKGNERFENITDSEAEGIINILKSLEIYVKLQEIKVIPYQCVMDMKIQYWVVKELYFSSYKAYLKDLKREVFVNKYLKAKKYCRSGKVEDLLNYFIKSLQNELEKREDNVMPYHAKENCENCENRIEKEVRK